MSEFTDEKVTVDGPVDQEEVEAKVEASDSAVEEQVLEQPSESETETVDEVTDETPSEDPAETDSTEESNMDENQAKAMEEYTDMPTPEPNTIITGKVVQIASDEVLVDIGYKSEGRIPANEMGLRPDQEAADLFSLEQDVEVFVLKVDDSEGNIVLSKRRADAQKAWVELEELYEAGKPINATVTQVVKGGLLVDLGVRGFIPASHISRNFVDNLDEYVGQSFDLKIIELDRQKNNVVLSRKNLLDEEFQKAKEAVFNTLEEDTIVDGVVRRVTDFGAFVDIGQGVEGLLHVSEMAHSRVNHPADVVSEGDDIKVMVLGVDKEAERISLGLKQTLPDPWSTIAEKYNVGDKVTGVVTRTVDFGAFVKLEDGVEGLVHISQLSHRHVAKTEEVVKSGDEVEVKVISVDPAAKRIGLSIRELEPAPEVKKEPKKQQPQVKEEPQEEELTTTLGDMFGDLFKDN